MKSVALILSAAVPGACTDNGQSYYLASIQLKKTMLACKDPDFINLIARNYENPRVFDEIVGIVLSGGNCRLFRTGQKVTVSINKNSGRMETIHDPVSGMHYATFDPVD